uniref:Uncharacterized protein n=1 Tax=Alexandrium andersonii TaxID=327968 RepID=A0A7S2AZ65_9DINO|mmetsp:Transcript_20105/g.45681  ORF Transcript_20105/g.45681 Transcript_20105/m.45681 type:complete len:547 (+) Transcript_20105:76-1716(+)
MDEIFTTAVTSLGGESSYIPLSKLLEDGNVRSYFQRTLIKPLWAEETFVVFFQSRPGQWDFDAKTRGVRVRSALADQINQATLKNRKKAPLPEKLYEALLRAGGMPETVAAVSVAGAAELAALPIDTVEALMDSFGKPLEAGSPIPPDAFASAQAKVIAAVPGALDKKGAALGMLMDFYGRVIKFGGEQVDAKVAAQRIDTLKELCETAATMIQEKGLGTVGLKAIGLLCQTAPLHVIASAIAGLGEKGDGDDVKALSALLGKVPPAMLEGLPRETLLRLATAATKSAAVAEAVLGIVAAASAATLPSWGMDDVSKLLLALCKAKAGADGPSVANLYGRAAEALFPKLPSMSDAQLIKVTLAFGRVPSCKEFLEAVAAEAVNRASNLPLPQLLLLTQGLVPLGGEHASFVKMLDFWASGADAAKVQLSADQLAKLAQVVAPVAPAHAAFWTKLGGQLVAQKGSLTDAGKASVEAAFPGGGGPAFADKEKLLQAEKPAKSHKDSEKDADKERDSKRRSRSRDDRRRGRSRSRGRDRNRSRSRDRKRR